MTKILFIKPDKQSIYAMIFINDIAKSDIRPFIKDHHSLDLWGRDFFKSITNHIQVDLKDNSD